MRGYLQYGRLYFLLEFFFLTGLYKCDKDITTVSTQDTNTRFVGTALVTEFASLEFATAEFLGIAYSEPAERFAKPVMKTPKPGIVRAKTFGNICPQVVSPWDWCHSRQKISEDCLFLNIYVPLDNISSHKLGVSVSPSATTSLSSGTVQPTDTSSKLNTPPEAPPISIGNASGPISIYANSVPISTLMTSSNDSASSKIAVSSIASTSIQTEMPKNSSASFSWPTNSSEELWSTGKIAMKRSAQPDDTFVLPHNSKYAVFIYLHGGAFVAGSGNCYDGSTLAGYGNIIVVTVNYRLSNLGFLSTNDDVIPGNLGLWDQHVAIQWVKKYINVFGGDPNRITVGGQSAGSYSSIHQALYKGNDGLFQRVIAQSGTPTAVKSASVTGYKSTLEVAKQLNCPTHGTKQQVKSCLMSKTAESLVNASLPMLVPGSLPIQPTVDEPFITEDPYTILSQMAPQSARKPQAVPRYFTGKDLLIGIDAQDGDVAWYLNAVLTSRHNSNRMIQLFQSTINPDLFRNLIRLYFQHDFNDTVDDYIISSVLERYIDWDHPNDYNSQSNRAIDFLTDVFFAIPVLDTASAHSRPREHSFTNGHESISEKSHMNYNTAKSPKTLSGTFVYRFSLPPHKDNRIPWFRGTAHGSEIKYVFGQVATEDERDVALSKTTMTYWSNFIKSGYVLLIPI